MGGPKQWGARRVLAMARRSFEVCLGLLLSMAALFSLFLCLGLVGELITGRSGWTIWTSLLGVVLAGLFVAWCAKTAWLLVTGRERKGGGLLSPSALIVAGSAFVILAVTMQVNRGSHGSGVGATRFLVVGFVCFGLARARLRQRAKHAA